MSVYLVNTTDSEDVDSPQAAGDSPGDPNKFFITAEAQEVLNSFWPKVMEEIRSIGQLDLKNQALPLARIKKIMKLDEDVKMISAEAPMLFSKAAEIFIHELTLRAWLHTEDNKRRTLQRNDIAMAISKYDQFDFLIDIVPRDEVKVNRTSSDGTKTSMNPDQVHYYFQLAQQHQAALQQSNSTATTNAQTIQVVPASTQLQTVTINNDAGDQNASATNTNTSNTSTTSQVIQISTPTATTASASTNNQALGNIQLVQQVVTPSGEVQQVPIQLSPAQLQLIRMQLQGNSNQPIILQTSSAIQGQPQVIQVPQTGTAATPVFLSTSNASTSEGE
ncbi:unnamed protein product [Bemisia tabaci]|uniref:Nuclear transcription factor Y subunit gamma n=1 Tax=Bemisia tabaci TaxID=7038 RepID=A0A9P0F2W4_BEMTA|nr:PREDICTED: nuclear transcription factor Y subunit gamma [Bemisia tabaci]CAH0387409.1 unnamed protein product [Bemisia tabaci]